MSQTREAVVAAAFAKLDRTGDGVVTVDDLRGVYSGQAHPKVCSGEWTEDEALQQFLDNFDTFEKDGQVCVYLVPPCRAVSLAWVPPPHSLPQLTACPPTGHTSRVPRLLQQTQRLSGYRPRVCGYGEKCLAPDIAYFTCLTAALSLVP